jgi:hypothetical protein
MNDSDEEDKIEPETDEKDALALGGANPLASEESIEEDDKGGD